VLGYRANSCSSAGQRCSASRSAGVPTVAETVPGYEASAWYGFGVPKATPREIVEKLNREVNEGLKDPAVLARFRELDVGDFIGARVPILNPWEA